MQKLRFLVATFLLALAGTAANAALIVEEYTGSQFVDSGDSYTFDFDLWYTNSGLVNDTAPGLTLTTDGRGAFGTWSSATLYLDFYSVDPEGDFANIDLDAWGFSIFGIPLWSTDILTLTGFDVSRPAGGSDYYHFSYSLTPAQIAVFDDYGWGSLRVGATRLRDNDFDLTRVGLAVTTGTVPEPGTLALVACGLLVLGITRRRKPTAM